MTKEDFKYTTIILLALLMFFLGWISYGYFMKGKVVPENDEKYQKTIDSLEQIINQKNLQYDSLLVVRDGLEEKVQDINDKLKALEKNYGQKVIDITTYTNPQLERFFTDRYGK